MNQPLMICTVVIALSAPIEANAERFSASGSGKLEATMAMMEAGQSPNAFMSRIRLTDDLPGFAAGIHAPLLSTTTGEVAQIAADPAALADLASQSVADKLSAGGTTDIPDDIEEKLKRKLPLLDTLPARPGAVKGGL